LVWTAWCVACQRVFFEALHAQVHLLTGHPQKRLLQSQLHVRIGQGLFGPPQMPPQLAHFIHFVGSFHADDLTIFAAAQLPHPVHNRVVAFDAVLTLHGLGSDFTAFHLPDSLHFEAVTITNYFHDTWIFSFQSTNLFQDGTQVKS
jgi:hypothetical protein